ncbi:response regulator transcription factor [Naasia lichenicola]|uniref:Response regulator transcription factor n=2 Tax=Naasia lichenicola TaxID=2565933 RepID=A0A4S4FSB3_9MICO|nr:response regulator transcription factor [Naasia lichenicola]THG33610.1 response regulator transcription factor [Naasia lichenicola]
MFDDYQDRVVVTEIDANADLVDVVDIVMYDSFAQAEADSEQLGELVRNPRAGKVVVYTWNFAPELIISAQDQGVHGYLSKTLPARELVAALERIHAGERIVTEPAGRVGVALALDWPGRKEGITDRESEILALITQGKNNSEVAALTYLSPNTIKTYIRSIYRKIGVTSRTQAVLWGVKHGFTPDFHRIDSWRGVS